MNPFRSPQYENSSKLMSQLESFHFHNTQTHNKHLSNKMNGPGKNLNSTRQKRILYANRIGSGNIHKKNLKGKLKKNRLILSEKAEKSINKGISIRKKSENWGGQEQRILLERPRKTKTSKRTINSNKQSPGNRSFRLFKKGYSGSPKSGGRGSNARTGNYSIGGGKLHNGRVVQKKTSWAREDTFQSQYDISIEATQSKENYNAYRQNISQRGIKPIKKMRKILGSKERESSLIESMQLSRALKTREPAMVFLKQKRKDKSNVLVLKTETGEGKNSQVIWVKKTWAKVRKSEDRKLQGIAEKKFKSCGDKNHRRAQEHARKRSKPRPLKEPKRKLIVKPTKEGRHLPITNCLLLSSKLLWVIIEK